MSRRAKISTTNPTNPAYDAVSSPHLAREPERTRSAAGRDRRLRRSRRGVAGLFMTAGALHFVIEKQYTRIVPAFLPNPKLLVRISGVAEFLGGLGVLVPRTRRFSGLGLIALLVAVFPANVNMALNPERWRKVPRWALIARLPLQLVAIRWVNDATKRRD